jgi:hypothetical protein
VVIRERGKLPVGWRGRAGRVAAGTDRVEALSIIDPAGAPPRDGEYAHEYAFTVTYDVYGEVHDLSAEPPSPLDSDLSRSLQEHRHARGEGESRQQIADSRKQKAESCLGGEGCNQ